MTAKQCMQHPWLSCRVDPEKILEISIKEEEEEEEEGISDQLKSTNQDTNCESITNENTSECESTNQNSDNSRLSTKKENPEEVLREISKENISKERGTSGDEEVKKFKKCSEDILESCGKGVDSSPMECNENKDSITFTPSSIGPMEADDDADNKVSYV